MDDWAGSDPCRHGNKAKGSSESPQQLRANAHVHVSHFRHSGDGRLSPKLTPGLICLEVKVRLPLEESATTAFLINHRRPR